MDSLAAKEQETLQKSSLLEATEEEISKIKLGESLGIQAERPKQTRRICALYQLFSYYFFRSEARSYIALKIVEIADKLNEKYKENISLMKEFRRHVPSGNHLEVRNYINYIANKDLLEFREGEEQINFFKQLLSFHDQRKEGKLQLSASAIKLNIAALKKIEEEAFECWLRLIDVNFELRNTIIGAENKKAIYYLANKYIDLYTILEEFREEFLKDSKIFVSETVKEYYETLRHFSLPASKSTNFKKFVHKKLESKMYEAQFLKLQAGNTVNYDFTQLEDNCKELKRQYLLSLKELSSIINYYKEIVIRYQTFFSFELEKLIVYIRENYLNLINILFKKLHDHNSFLKGKNFRFNPEDIDVVIELEREKIESSVKELQTKYSKILIPLVSSFDAEIENVENRYCFNIHYSERKYTTLKELKNRSIEAFVQRFKEEKDRLEKFMNDKRKLLENMEDTLTEETNSIVAQLREECNAFCEDLLRENQYFWTRFNAEFNGESRRYLVRLHHEYSPFIHSWKEGEEGWMEEYLKLKINLEYLRKIGESIREFTPEGKFHEKCASILGSYANYFRNVCIHRDKVEYDCLLKLNTIPIIDYDKVDKKLRNSLDALEESHRVCADLAASILQDRAINER
ncbi:hypothetical protein MHLP_03450 [Candidatus Mycoplasma haematolamae str. Purdue]|uniref:Uncharacterized protein n=1 Tax=Mycoplasma haematolamae (strain Purdue) TaxID=1212765 RepID=I7BAE6_MYCHA|nr:hypothetical protein [Candidatus Mycoplasma haematolamae]AFO52270.1 hypothetical protein MHLP_03450 [Candidatus Mycoplasma haematolamae str. Purdue]